MKCNKCWSSFDHKSKGIASTCGHLFCLACAEEILGSISGGSCPLCEAIITKSTVKVVTVLQDPKSCQLSLCGQEPETALNSALASVKFFVQQKELSAGLLQSKLEANVERVKEGCKRKLQEVHNGYLHAKKKYQEAAEMKNALQADNEELKLKYQQKAQQARKVMEVSKKLQAACEKLQHENDQLRQGGPRSRAIMPMSHQNDMMHPTLQRPNQVVTTMQQRQIYLGQKNSHSTGMRSHANADPRALDWTTPPSQRVDNRGLGTTNLDLANSKENYLPFQRRENGMKLTHDFAKQTPGRGFLQSSRNQPNTLQGPTNRFLSSFPRSPSELR